MRRILRPSRAIDPSRASCSSLRQWVSPQRCPPRRTASAAFSTTLSRSFLLPGKQDKKKHQQFVRRWQKRLLGDSEPIGAHVDPYDPTSPVRIAPEEQGEYEEVLDEDKSDFPLYTPAERSRKLLHVGGKHWLRQKREGDIAKEFEKLTRRTYTPLTLEMANEIEELTGTPYTLKDENLMMAQTVHHVTGRPYTVSNFGLHKKATTPNELRSRFVQAVTEVHVLKQAGLDMDLSKLVNRGVYKPPRWVRDIRLSRTESGKLALVFPEHKSAEKLLQAMQTAPTWESTQTVDEEGLLIEDARELLEPSLQPPTMDPETPTFKRAAVVKIDPDMKPFDFMSNRPVPRTKPTDKKAAEEATQFKEPSPQMTAPTASPNSGITAVELPRSPISKSNQPIVEHGTSHLADDVLTLRNTVQQDKLATSAPKVEEVKWRPIPITDLVFKFALFKRLLQLTGHRISDPQLSSANTLGDLYGHLCVAAKPRPKSLFSEIHVEGQKARERTKQQSEADISPRRRADLGDLIHLGNVELRRVKPTKTEKRINTGLDKVVQYALWERSLRSGNPQKLIKRREKTLQVVEGTRQAPDFGKPMSSKGASFLAKKTREWIEEQENLKRALTVQ